MTQQQWLSIATLVGMMALFIWGRFRYDVTAVLALLVALVIGIVKPEDAFAGFSDDIGAHLTAAQDIVKVQQRMAWAAARAREAELLAASGKIEQAFGKWSLLLPGYFPAYG